MTKEIEKIITKALVESEKRLEKNLETKFEKRLKHHTESLIEVINDKFEIVKEQFVSVFEKQDSHTEQIGNVLVDLSEVKINLKSVSYDVAIKLDNKLDKKHFADLDGRVRKLEKR